GADRSPDSQPGRGYYPPSRAPFRFRERGFRLVLKAAQFSHKRYPLVLTRLPEADRSAKANIQRVGDTIGKGEVYESTLVTSSNVQVDSVAAMAIQPDLASPFLDLGDVGLVGERVGGRGSAQRV